MINEKVLGEKLKYLITGELLKYFDVMKFEVDFYYNIGTKNQIEGYMVDIKFDYLGGIDADVEQLGRDIKKMSKMIRPFFEKYQISPEGKLVMDGGYYVDAMMIWNIDFEFDQKQIFDVSFKVNLFE